MDAYEDSNQGSKKTLWIIGGVILLIMIVAVIYGITQKTINNNTENLTIDENSSVLKDNQVKAGQEMITTPVALKTLDLVNLQTIPQKVQARITADLADACSRANAVVTSSGNSFTITLTAQKPKDSVCAQVVTAYESIVDLPVAELALGKYSVTVGGISKTFTLSPVTVPVYGSDK